MGRRKRTIENNPIISTDVTNATIIVDSNGEVLRETKEVKIKWEKEPDFIKLYYDTMLAFHGVEGIPGEFLSSLAKHVKYANKDTGQMKVYLNTELKEDMCETLGIKKDMLNKLLQRCVANGLLFRSGGKQRTNTYIVNPFFIAKGEWKNIRKLQCSFNFIDGRWTMETEIDEGEENI